MQQIKSTIKTIGNSCEKVKGIAKKVGSGTWGGCYHEI